MALFSLPGKVVHSRLLRVKRLALLLFLGGGSALSLASLFIPTYDAANAPLGRILFGVTLLLSWFPLALMGWRPAVLSREWFDWLIVLAGSASVALAATAETMTFGTQSAAITILWPMLLAAGFMNRRAFWGQFVLGGLITLEMAWVKSVLVKFNPLWYVEVIVLTIPVFFAMLIILLFREAAQRDAEELEALSITDPLTGLPNRRALPGQFAAVMRHLPTQHKLALVVLDIDHFKRVNDQYGHAGGDEVLRAFADVMRSQARPGDILARMGGEEFLWVMHDQTPEALLERVEGLRQAVHHSVAARNVTVSAGVTIRAGAELTEGHWEEMLARADAALYRAKEEGRDCLRAA